MKRKMLSVFCTIIAVICCAVGLSACNFGNDNTGGDNPSNITNPSNPNNQNNNYNSKYSGILNNVLNSGYYNGLIAQVENGSLKSNTAVEPIPYTFLEKQGYDINKLKCNFFAVGAGCYFKENNKNDLFLNVTVSTDSKGDVISEKPSDDDVYNEYVLKYKLTDKEREDLIMLYNGKYIQSGFFIQELDKQKTPTLVRSFKINQKSNSIMLEALNNKKALQGLFGENKIWSFTPLNIVKAEDEKKGYRLKISVISTEEKANKYAPDKPVSDRQMCELDLFLYLNADVSIKNNIIEINRAAFDVENKTEPFNITFLCTFYSSITGYSMTYNLNR